VGVEVSFVLIAAPLIAANLLDAHFMSACLCDEASRSAGGVSHQNSRSNFGGRLLAMSGQLWSDRRCSASVRLICSVRPFAKGGKLAKSEDEADSV
jgi:hypothetical protein